MAKVSTTPEMRNLIRTADALREDLLQRAELDDDSGKVVNASHGRWLRFCAALREAKVRQG